MTSVVQEAGCVSVFSVIGTEHSTTRQTQPEPGGPPRFKPASVDSYSCSHWPACCFSDDGPSPTPVRLWRVEEGGTTGRTKRGLVGRGVLRNFAKKMKWKRHFGEWMDDIFFDREEQDLTVTIFLYFVLLSYYVFRVWFSLLSWFQWIVGRKRRRGRRK